MLRTSPRGHAEGAKVGLQALQDLCRTALKPKPRIPYKLRLGVSEFLFRVRNDEFMWRLDDGLV